MIFARADFKNVYRNHHSRKRALQCGQTLRQACDSLPPRTELEKYWEIIEDNHSKAGWCSAGGSVLYRVGGSCVPFMAFTTP
jgi:hypothetical protein